MLRVRQILDAVPATTKAQLKKLLPKGLTMPTAETARYPSAVLSAFPKEFAHSMLGLVAEALLQKDSNEITLESLVACIQTEWPEVTQEALQLVRKSKTTSPFLTLLQETRRQIETVKREDIQYDRVLAFDSVQGHPDGINSTQVFEVKLTGLLKQGWSYFLMQLFSYAALELTIQDLYLVLPLQKTVWHYSISTSGWTGRKAYRELLNTAAKQIQRNAGQDALVGALLRERFFIGFHASKQKTLLATLQSLPDYRKPYQIFLGGPQNTTMRIEDGELAAAASFLQENRVQLFVHSQYIINLCSAADSWNTELLKKNLIYANTIGCKGVVVHVGKSTTQPLADALAAMRGNLLLALEAATEECPVLLETPAGQGTETLKGQQEFIDFVAEINDPRLRVCLDTCHVFACGHKPLEYIEALGRREGLLKLVHYNDSATPCGSCVDRHAFMGTGHIGMEGMKAIAEACGAKGLPMVIE